MTKRKFGFERFGINKQTAYNFEPVQGPRQLYVPTSSSGSPHDNYEDHNLSDIEYEEPACEGADDCSNEQLGSDEVDPLNAFMEGIRQEAKSVPVKPRAKMEIFKNDDDDLVGSFLKARRDVGLSLAAVALQARYHSDEEVYAAAKAVDSGQLEYDSSDNPIITLDKKKTEAIPAINHSEIDYMPFSKDFYEEKPSLENPSVWM